MHVFIDPDSRCSDCYGSGKRLYYADADDNHGTEMTCETCKGTGRCMSALGQELFDVLKEYFDITPRKR